MPNLYSVRLLDALPHAPATRHHNKQEHLEAKKKQEEGNMRDLEARGRAIAHAVAQAGGGDSERDR